MAGRGPNVSNARYRHLRAAWKSHIERIDAAAPDNPVPVYTRQQPIDLHPVCTHENRVVWRRVEALTRPDGDAPFQELIVSYLANFHKNPW